MRRWITLSLLLLGAQVTVPVTAWSQEPTRERVQVALDITDRRLEQASQLVGGSQDERARGELRIATDVQTRAKAALGGSQFGLAMRLTLEARNHADRAIAILRGPDPDGVTSQVERTRDLLDRARERVEGCNQPRARALMRSAFAMQERAETTARDGRFLAALQLTVSARERALRALRQCDLSEDLQDAAERAIHRTDELVDRAREVVDERGPEAARQALARAMESQERAWREFRAERFELALRTTQAARAMAHRALRLAGGGF